MSHGGILPLTQIEQMRHIHEINRLFPPSEYRLTPQTSRAVIRTLNRLSDLLKLVFKNSDVNSELFSA